MITATITLDIATYEGKTWLARISGYPGGKFGFDREFVNAINRHTSRSGATGSVQYEVDPGLYESNEGRRRLGRRYWIVDAQGDISEIDQHEAIEKAKAL